MTKAVVPNAIAGKSPELQPGYLSVPLGWAAQPLLSLVNSNHGLAADLLQIDRARMHLMALVFAHCEDRNIRTNLLSDAQLLLRGSFNEVVDATLQKRLIGLKRTLEKLPIKVLSQESYRHLAESLEEEASAKLMHQADGISEAFIEIFHTVPQPIRRIVALTALSHSIELPGLADALHLLASRGAAPSFDALIAELAAIRQPAQFVARIRKLIAALPLPQCTPPASIGHAKRIDDSEQIRRLGRIWRNCLEAFVDEVNNGIAAIYLWPHRTTPAACLAWRFGRIGWALKDVKGPRNADLPAERALEIKNAFAEVGIVHSRGIWALKRIMEEPSHRRAREIIEEETEIEEMYEEFDAD